MRRHQFNGKPWSDGRRYAICGVRIEAGRNGSEDAPPCKRCERLAAKSAYEDEIQLEVLNRAEKAAKA